MGIVLFMLVHGVRPFKKASIKNDIMYSRISSEKFNSDNDYRAQFWEHYQKKKCGPPLSE